MCCGLQLSICGISIEKASCGSVSDIKSNNVGAHFIDTFPEFICLGSWTKLLNIKRLAWSGIYSSHGDESEEVCEGGEGKPDGLFGELD
jgi:hypothetical protein